MRSKYIPWDLLISHLKRETSIEEEQVLSEWRCLEENDSLYKEIHSLWNKIIDDSSSYHPDSNYYWEEMLTRMEAKEDRKKTITIPLYRTQIAIIAASVLLLISVFSSYYITKNNFLSSAGTQTFQAVNGKAQVTLPDGSLVWLNIGSTLTYETTFTDNRQVKLDGEALFDVQQDTKHPFIVSVEDVQVKVIGTRFNVEAYSTKEAIRVALLNGKVAVYANTQQVEMNPGDIITYNKNTNLLSKTAGDTDLESLWAGSSYTFNKKSLNQICKHLEHWYDVEIEIDPNIGDSQVYTFTVTDEPLETILKIMSRINPIQYSFEDGKRVIIKKVLPH